MRLSVAKYAIEIVLATMCIFILASWMLLLAPQFAGMDRSYIVVGRSMEKFRGRIRRFFESLEGK